MNLEYKFNGINDRNGDDGRPVDEFNANLAFAYQFTLNENATMSIWPVIELTYAHNQRDRADGEDAPNTGGDILQFSPGTKFVRQSLMLAVLVQIPVQPRSRGDQMDRRMCGLIGVGHLVERL